MVSRGVVKEELLWKGFFPPHLSLFQAIHASSYCNGFAKPKSFWNQCGNCPLSRFSVENDTSVSNRNGLRAEYSWNGALVA
jgi:hypothetical protein